MCNTAHVTRLRGFCYRIIVKQTASQEIIPIPGADWQKVRFQNAFELKCTFDDWILCNTGSKSNRAMSGLNGRNSFDGEEATEENISVYCKLYIYL